MSALHRNRPVVSATALEIMPTFGLAFVLDEHGRTWAVTRSTAGPGLQSLREGQRVRLTLDHHRQFSLVSAYEPEG